MTLNPEVATVVILLVAIVVFIWNRVSPAIVALAAARGFQDDVLGAEAILRRAQSSAAAQTPPRPPWIRTMTRQRRCSFANSKLTRSRYSR